MKSKRIFKETFVKTENNINSKIPYSNKEEIIRYKNKTEENIYHHTRMIKLTRKDVEKIKKLQKWWKNLMRLNPYRKSQKIFFRRKNDNMQEKHSSNSSSNDLGKNKYDNSTNNNYRNKFRYSSNSNSNSSFNTNVNSYSNNTYNNNLKKNHYSKSYTNVNNTYNTYNSTNSNKKNYYIQNITRKTDAASNNQYPGSLSTSPSVKSRYFVETRKIEIFKKPNYSDNKPYSKSSRNSFISFSELSKFEVKNMIRNIWNEESFCSTVESLSCLSSGNRSINNNDSLQNNTILLEEYEEEIHKLRKLLVDKNKNWNEINIPSPINEIHIESFKNDSQKEQFDIDYMLVGCKEKKNNLRGTISNASEDILEIQEINALSIISTKNKNKNIICQHLQSMTIFSDKNYKQNNEIKLSFQKIEEINITSIIPKQKNQNKIQELDGIQILNTNNDSKIKNDLIIQKLDRIFIRCFSHNNFKIIQELDGLQILKQEKQVKIFPQCVDELLIQRAYDMSPGNNLTSNELKIQGSGLNILSFEKNKELEEQQMDKFYIAGLPLSELGDQTQEKIKVLIPLAENSIIEKERFTLKGIENIDKQNILEKVDNIELKGEENIKEKINILNKNDWSKLIKPIKATKLVIKSDKKSPKKIIQKEKIETVERIYYNNNKNWNGIIKPIKTTKLNIKGIKFYNIWDNLNIEEKDNIYIANKLKEKEELITESFAFNLTENNKQFRDELLIENNGFYLIDKKINKEQNLLPCRCEQINLEELSINNNNEKIELKMIKENYLFIKGKNKIIENEINLNELNKEKLIFIKQTSNIISLSGLDKPKPQIITVQKNWKNILRGQKSCKFSLLAKEKAIKNNKLLVANGDKFFIQKEIEDDIIYNDDYNSRREKLKSAKKENEIVIPKYQREIRAQIAKVKEISESESSSLSELDVLEGIKNKKYLNNDLKNITNGYEMKIINGEVIYTAKNKIGDDLGVKKEENKIMINNESFKKNVKKKQIIINNFRISKTLENFDDNNMNGQNVINKSFNTYNNNNDNDDIIMSPRFPNNENKINLSNINNIKGQIIFNPKFTTIKSHYSTKSFNIPRSGNVVINSRREYEKPLLAKGGNISDRILNEKKKNDQIIKIKRSKIKNVELLRDYDSQYSF